MFLIYLFLSQAFFDKDYITKHPGDAEKITQLKELMQEQVWFAGLGGSWPVEKAMYCNMSVILRGCSLVDRVALFVTLIGPRPWSWASSS